MAVAAAERVSMSCKKRLCGGKQICGRLNGQTYISSYRVALLLKTNLIILLIHMFNHKIAYEIIITEVPTLLDVILEKLLPKF